MQRGHGHTQTALCSVPYYTNPKFIRTEICELLFEHQTVFSFENESQGDGEMGFFFLPCTACYLECLQALKMCKYKVYQIFTLFLSRFLCRSTLFFSKSLKPFETATAGWLIGVQFHSIWWLHCVITTYLDKIEILVK